MFIPLQFASLYDRQEVFLLSDCLLDLWQSVSFYTVLSVVGDFRELSDVRCRFCSGHAPRFETEEGSVSPEYVVCGHFPGLATVWLAGTDNNRHKQDTKRKKLRKSNDNNKNPAKPTEYCLTSHWSYCRSKKVPV